LRPGDKERLIVEVVQRVMDRCARGPRAIESSIFDTLYEERKRLESDPNGNSEQTQRYDRIHAEALDTSPQRQHEILQGMVEEFTMEVAGHFDPRVYAVATRAVPLALNIMLNTLSPLRLLGSLPGWGGKLYDQVVTSGETERLKTLARLGTTILVPTHSSNLDSILVAFALFRLGLPPFTYGAGLNLFANRLIGFFMQNLGAYKVDRRKNAALYKDVLKVYAGRTMEMGYHNLFFPGGTRSRSGSVEKRLKLGLLGMALDAYIHNLAAGVGRPDIFVVPCTINYQLVLEAETLIDDHLKELGRSRYIIDDDEFSRPRLVLDFTRKLFTLDSRVHLVFGRPMDVFGNEVDEQGRSLDPRGRALDRTMYVRGEDGFTFDRQRDREYARELAESVTAAYHRDTVVQSVNLVSRAVYNLLCERNPDMDMYRLLRTGGAEQSFALPEVYERIEATLEELKRMATNGEVRLDEVLQRGDIVSIVGHALTHLGSFHRRVAIHRKGDRLYHKDRNLILYYGNRLSGFEGI